MDGPVEVLRDLERQHVVTWPHGSLDVVALVSLGETEERTGQLLRLSDRTVRRRLGQARLTLSDATGIPANTAMVRTWFWLHKGCCAVSTLRKLSGSAH